MPETYNVKLQNVKNMRQNNMTLAIRYKMFGCDGFIYCSWVV